MDAAHVCSFEGTSYGVSKVIEDPIGVRNKYYNEAELI